MHAASSPVPSFRRWPQSALIAVVRGYRWALSPWLGTQCRFWPTCSAYALGALEAHGALAGSYLAACRIGRCHPWCQGGLDPVPERPPAFFTRFTSKKTSS